ncbi:MAG: CPBP family intramembrane glutamic endopeptidase [Candidatus Aminicenantes bacterium]
MSAWLENGAGPDLPLALVYLELTLALALLATVLHFRRLRKTRPELLAVRTYFAALFGLLLVVPCLIVILTAAEPLRTLASWGWTFGRSELGLMIVAAGLPLAVLASAFGSRDPEMIRMYPFAKDACSSMRTFTVYQASYVLLYYLPWEFIFRGVLFLPLVPAVGLLPALAVQTLVSTLFHIGHPDSEVFAAVGAGLLFGTVAWLTGSFFYTFVLHAASGMATDIILYRRSRKERS